eukprot:TRINITY_DN4192_c0_g1_i1.p1 TRINITY_DN4192_c0_g1~~TRINITY_DN4192_c0_g1_i1.p1  ORF type:complete len:1019 (+),score=200.52 TRINITY_DN4192_c0_g1_i1:55-3111(+)
MAFTKDKVKNFTSVSQNDAEDVGLARPRPASSVSPRCAVLATALAMAIGISAGIGIRSALGITSILSGSSGAFLAPKDEDSLSAADKLKIKQLLNLSSHIWPVREGRPEVKLLHGLLPASVENPLVMDLTANGMGERLHDIRAKFDKHAHAHGIINLPRIVLEEEALDILEAISQVGWNGVASQCIEGGQTQPQHCHRVGAVLMDVAMSRTNNLTHYLEATGGPYTSPSDQLWHGGVMHWAATTAHLPGNMWKHFHAQIAPSRSVPMNSWLVWNLWHASGHGAVIRAALRANHSLRAEYTPYHPFWDGSAPRTPEAVFLEADSTCSRAPNELAAFNCANGIVHHLVMHMAIANEHVQDWAYPCDKAQSFWTAAGCFYFSTLIMPNAKADSWRYRKVLKQPKRWSELCLQLHPEHVVRGCIFGLSANMFPLFEHAVAEATLEAAGEDGLGQRGAIMSRKKLCDGHFNDVLCAMVPREHAKAAPAGQSIIQWCSRFMTSGNEDKDLLRFYTCVDGSQWSNGEWGGWWNLRGPHIDEESSRSYCNQLLSSEWHADEKIRSKASELCFRRILSLRQLAAPWPSLDMPSTELGLVFETQPPQGEASEELALPQEIDYLEPDSAKRLHMSMPLTDSESVYWQDELVKDFGTKQQSKFDTFARHLEVLLQSTQFQQEVRPVTKKVLAESTSMALVDIRPVCKVWDVALPVLGLDGMMQAMSLSSDSRHAISSNLEILLEHWWGAWIADVVMQRELNAWEVIEDLMSGNGHYWSYNCPNTTISQHYCATEMQMAAPFRLHGFMWEYFSTWDVTVPAERQMMSERARFWCNSKVAALDISQPEKVSWDCWHGMGHALWLSIARRKIDSYSVCTPLRLHSGLSSLVPIKDACDDVSQNSGNSTACIIGFFHSHFEYLAPGPFNAGLCAPEKLAHPSRQYTCLWYYITDGRFPDMPVVGGDLSVHELIDGEVKLDLAEWCTMATWMQGKAETCEGDTTCEGILADSVNYFQSRCAGQDLPYPFVAVQKR